jgi:FkbM family methyltransferase
MLYPESKILAFEPNKETFDVLGENIKNNQLDNVNLDNAAVYDREGSLTFYIDDKDAMTSVYNTVDQKWLKDTGNKIKEISVPCVRLSNYINQNVDFFKIDIEGAEYEVFPEIEGKIKMMQRIGIEYHCSDNNDQNGPDKLLNIITRNGFKYVITGFISPPYSIIENKAYGGIIYYRDI